MTVSSSCSVFAAVAAFTLAYVAKRMVFRLSSLLRAEEVVPSQRAGASCPSHRVGRLVCLSIVWWAATMSPSCHLFVTIGTLMAERLMCVCCLRVNGLAVNGMAPHLSPSAPAQVHPYHRCLPVPHGMPPCCGWRYPPPACFARLAPELRPAHCRAGCGSHRAGAGSVRRVGCCRRLYGSHHEADPGLGDGRDSVRVCTRCVWDISQAPLPAGSGELRTSAAVATDAGPYGRGMVTLHSSV